jgi:uncharacterized protein (DUF433 family)
MPTMATTGRPHDAATDRSAAWRRHADAIVEAYIAGWTIRRLQAVYGLWDSDLYRLLAERGIPTRRTRRTRTHGPLPSTDELARAYRAGATATELARLYGVSRATIGNRLRQTGTPTRSPRQTALLHHHADWEHLAPEILAAIRAGRTTKQIRAAFPISERHLRRLRREHRIHRPTTPQEGNGR